MPLYTLETLGELHPFLNYEWLLTNGLGSFASSSLVGCNTRRYHGLLCAATMPPVGRIMALNRIGELVYLDGQSHFLELSVNRFAAAVHPRGDRFLRRFELDHTARWHFELEGISITKEVLLAWKRNLVGIRYTVQAAPNRSVELQLLPFISLRDFHGLQHKEANFAVTTGQPWQLSATHGDHTVHFIADSGQFERRGDWWFGHTYPIETERGLSDTEDLYVPGKLTRSLPGGGAVTLWATTDAPAEHYDWDAELARLQERRKAQWLVSNLPTPTIERLARAADDFVVSRKQPDGQPGITVIAGYPWFADWGRDTMISLPGLLLTTGRFAEARQVLSVFADYVSEGMIPNRFDDYSNEPHYNTLDASLWFIHAAFEYLRLSKDSATFEAKLLPACRAIVKGYREGTRFNIKMDASDGLICAGDPSTQLTWMDAKCDGVVFTPRHGKAVEINALWYNALMLLGETELADKVRGNFVKTFWRNPFRGLFDVVNERGKDDAIRPNQIFAVSLPHSPLDHDQQRAVVETVRRELLTPYGLKTLSKDHSKYRGRFAGGPMERDGAYHNGTIWAWLMGPFLSAYLRVHDHSEDARRQARVWLQPLLDYLNQGCIGQVPECFEADEPHRSVACPAQAWSVAEVLRLASELSI